MAYKVELSWDCKYCGTHGILGRYRECPNCAKPRDKDTKFYLPNSQGIGSKVSTKLGHNIVDEKDVKSKGPDWHCESCESYNPDWTDSCLSCGAPRYGSKNYAEINRDKQDLSSSARAAIREKYINTNHDREYNPSDNDAFESKEDVSKSIGRNRINKNWIKEHAHDLKRFGIITTCMLLIISIFVVLGLFFSQEEIVTVQELHWKYSVQIEEYTELHESGWSVPDGGVVSYTREEIHHYETVLDHYDTVMINKQETYLDHYETVPVQRVEQYLDHYETEYIYEGDDGNGYGSVRTVSIPVYNTRYVTEYEQRPVYETRHWTEPVQKPVYREEPVKQTKYYYDIWRWVYSRTLKNEGQVTEKPQFPNPNLAENERFGRKYKEYWVVAVNNKEEKKTYKTTEEIWKQLSISDEIIVGKFSSTITEVKKK